jgi:hypothetical protein
VLKCEQKVSLLAWRKVISSPRCLVDQRDRPAAGKCNRCARQLSAALNLDIPAGLVASVGLSLAGHISGKTLEIAASWGGKNAASRLICF